MDNEESLQTQMQNLMASKQWERAKDVIYEMLARQPESSWLHCNMGSVLYHLEEFQGAEIHLKTAIAHDPGYSDAYNYLAWVYMGMGRMGTADDCNKTALSLDPNDPQNLILAIHLALAYDDIPQAERHLRNLEREIPEGAILTSQRTAILSHPKNKNKIDVHKQIEAHKESLSQDPEYTLAHAQIAELHLKYTKKYTVAEEHIKKALVLEPDSRDYHLLYAKILRKRNPIIRVLGWPLSLFEKAESDDKEYYYIIGAMLLIAILGSTLPPHLQPVLKIAILVIIGSLVLLYPILKLYEYLTLTELYHEMKKVHLFKGPFRKIHRLSYLTRFTIFAVITLAFWATIFIISSKYLTL